jgi:hypothetical protein
VRPSTVLLGAGYALAVPFTVFVPGFLRLWRRRERWTYACAQGGAALVVLGWLAQGRWSPAAVNALLLTGFGVHYVREGRKRARGGRLSR